MRLSVVVVVHDMPSTAMRSLYSLSSAHQEHVPAEDYEVLVVENGSTRPLDAARVEALPGCFRYLPVPDPSPSPAHAVNYGLAHARGDLVGLILDGARLATPRLLSLALRAAATHPRPAITTVGWALGRGAARPRSTPASPEADAAVDELLRTAGWPDVGYRVFAHSRPDGSGHELGPAQESPALFMPAALWAELGGMDERFDEPGGGFVALDLYWRLIERPDVEPILLVGEGTIHQPHGGVSTDAPPGGELTTRILAWRDQYIAIKGHDLRFSDRELTYFGTLPAAWRVQLVAWMMRWSMDEVPELADVVDLLEPGANAAGIGGGSAWGELSAVGRLLADARCAARDATAAARRASADAAAARADLARLEGTLSWTLTAPLRRLGALAARRRRD
jgi:hypothetical protein